MSEAKDQNENFDAESENQPEAANEQPTADALGQAEAILNEAGADVDEAEAQQGEASATETELRNDLLRLQAEYVNYRKRVERDRAVARESAVQSVLTTILPVLDEIDAARAHGDLTDGPFAAIANKLDTILVQHGLERINEAGVEFDPNIHEALLRQAVPEVPADHVGQVLRNGYRKGTTVLRAAQVLVATGE
ncbi:nucleotide exchange factor GrpE [Glutamicibacter mishrai]|uniref:Protein GrpE n=1 Tax=Glutamicibacter mishrai TaxID=1775880 RepID=A0A6H0SK37_9MICC|nr:nucleotide exchange factor GrpE [Glutamicibacter mishrai]QIV86347.1 nucleotide exchange factor GrpE [Glutamicibacter mishrai]UTT38926.1 nucleotide exchange factor GrpE [Glutamicibacter mishrai]